MWVLDASRWMLVKNKCGWRWWGRSGEEKVKVLAVEVEFMWTKDELNIFWKWGDILRTFVSSMGYWNSDGSIRRRWLVRWGCLETNERVRK